MIWELDAGWGRPLCNRAVFGPSGSLVGIPDLIDPGRGIVGEFAGAHHRDIDRHASDIAREPTSALVGLEYVEAVGPRRAQPPASWSSVCTRPSDPGGHPAADLGARTRRRAPTLDELLDRRDVAASVE